MIALIISIEFPNEKSTLTNWEICYWLINQDSITIMNKSHKTPKLNLSITTKTTRTFIDPNWSSIEHKSISFLQKSLLSPLAFDIHPFIAIDPQSKPVIKTNWNRPPVSIGVVRSDFARRFCQHGNTDHAPVTGPDGRWWCDDDAALRQI